MAVPIRNQTEAARAICESGEAIRALGVPRLALFGTLVRGEQDVHRDVDLLVEIKPRHNNFSSFMRLAFLLEDLTGRRVGLVTPESLSPYLGPHTIKEAEHVSRAD